MTTQERLRKADYCVRPVPLVTAHRCEALYHYARGGSKAGKAYGLFPTGLEASALGVAHYNMCQREQGDLAWAGGWREVWTLHRLAIAPAVPVNAASFLIRRSARLLARDTGCRCLLAYSDTWQGHTGHVYRAAGWEYAGLVRGDKTWVDPRTGRLVAQRRGNRTLTDAEMAARGYVDHGYHDKHRYRLVLPVVRPARTLFDRLRVPPEATQAIDVQKTCKRRAKGEPNSAQTAARRRKARSRLVQRDGVVLHGGRGVSQRQRLPPGAADPQRPSAGRWSEQPGAPQRGPGARSNDAGDGGAEVGA